MAKQGIKELKVKVNSSEFSDPYYFLVDGENVSLQEGGNLETKLDKIDKNVSDNGDQIEIAKSDIANIKDYSLPELQNGIDDTKTEINNLGNEVSLMSNDISGLQSDISQINAELENKAPKFHLSPSTTYGVATESAYGHVKITDQGIYDGSDASRTVASLRGIINILNNYITLNNSETTLRISTDDIIFGD